MSKLFIKNALIPGFAILAVLVSVCPSVSADKKKSAIITAYDLYIPPDKELDGAGKYKKISLKGKLESEGALNINPDIEGEVLSFYLDGKFIGDAKTNEDGFARALFSPSGRMESVITVKLEGSKKYRAKEDAGLVYMIDAKKPTIIVDIDWTVADTDRSSLLLHATDDETKPLPGSQKALKELKGLYNIVFITGREDALSQKTKGWLKKWQFPRLPVLFSDFGQTPYISQSTYKEEAVAKVKEEIKNTVAGVGDRTYDAEAYMKSGLKALVIRPVKDPVPGALNFDDWQGVKAELLKEEYFKVQ